MEKKIAGLNWQPRMNSYLGSLKGCLDYLKIDVTDAWLYGAIGKGLSLNIPVGS